MNIILLINCCIAALSVMFVYQAIIDYIDGRIIRFYQNNNFDQLKISIVIKFDGNYNELIDQIDNIENQKYNNIEIIALTSKKYFDELRKIIYDADRKDFEIRVVKSQQRRSLMAILNKSCSGQLILKLDQGDRLSDRFLSSVNNFACANPKQSIIYPIHQFRISNTLISLLVAQTKILRRFWTDIFGININLNRVQAGVIYRKKVTESNKKISISIYRLASISREPLLIDIYDYINSKISNVRIKSGQLLYVMLGLLLVTIFAILIIAININFITTLIVFLLSLYFIVNIFMQFRHKGYSIMERIDLMLITPIALIINSIIIVLGLISRIVSLFNKRVNENN